MVVLTIETFKTDKITAIMWTIRAPEVPTINL